MLSKENVGSWIGAVLFVVAFFTVTSLLPQ